MSDTTDTLRRFVFEAEEIRGSIVRLDNTWQQLLTNEQYPQQVSQLLGEAAAAIALLGRNLKFDGRLTLQIQGNEHLRLLVMQCDNNLRLRGLARFGDEPLPEAFTELVDNGTLCVTVESSTKAERYQSIVPLSEINLAECLGLYYRQSVQLPSLFMLAADEQRATGLMFQVMPERKAGSGRWQQLMESLAGLDMARLAALDDELLMTALFPEDDIRLFDSEPVAFHCDCSDERIENMLRILGPEELGSLVTDQNPVEICCEFCNRQYEVSAERIWGIVAELTGSTDSPLH
jgi:molecular chaperone Hsp33